MALRDLKALNKGSFLGCFWLIISPLIQVCAYVFIVSFIFKKRMNDGSGTFQYAIYVLSGMIPWQVLTRTLQQSPMLIRQRMELVKQIIYPIETLPISNLITSSLGLCVSFLVFFILSAFSHNLYWSWILLPIPLCLLVLFVLGVSWAFSIIGVIVKDLREIVTVFL
ncbi:MAG: ABC transporter permease, partial [Candidatus Theseobacter exili]|nr:ABC transporter permease [Candidatus Theseobacter exili]